ncbi:Non-heme chloroperoxidase [Pleurostoma richardsiae]|uniref:Non-heme chloroperoxidase n=1 Tax=Pleurostoma richardsiae TaxID=41990 RepID=A0AA38VP25_9PEZI|nr:Non-heme chloroperoxidase [Pleurostoma richardsiae]
MPLLTLKDGNTIYYKDWGNPSGHVVTFSHGWPLNSDNWENQMFFLANHGYRVIAHDRRGHGRSSQPWDGNDMDTYADDLNQLFEHLDLKDIMMVGHSTGGGEVARYIGKYGTSRVKKAVLVSAVPPLMLQTEANPEGLPLSVFDSFREAMVKDRSQFFLDVPTGPFFGFNRPGAKASQGLIQSWWQQGMIAGFKNTYDCIKAFSETDLTEDLKRMDIPVLILHGDDDQVVPIKAAGLKSIELVPNGRLKIYPGGPHALPNIHVEEVNRDLLDFLQA